MKWWNGWQEEIYQEQDNDERVVIPPEEQLKIKVKVLYESRYKNSSHFQEAIENWERKGWELVVESTQTGYESYAILTKIKYRLEESNEE